MKALNTWIVVFAACSAFSTQASAETLLMELQNASSTRQSAIEIGTEDGNDTDTITNSIRPVFVENSLIDKSGKTAWLMADSVKGDTSTHFESVVANGSAGRRVVLTPIPPAGTQLRPISTFAQFAQNFRSAPQNHDDSDSIQAMVSGEIVPKTSNMTFVGVFAFSLAGMGAVISGARCGWLFGRTSRQQRTRLY
jgi:hypothetical protein